MITPVSGSAGAAISDISGKAGAQAVENAWQARQSGTPAHGAGGDTISISQAGRDKAGQMQAKSQDQEGGGQDAAAKADNALQALAVDKEEVVKDLQDTESDIRTVKDSIREAENSSMLSEDEREREVKKLQNKLDRLEDEASDMKGDLSQDE